MLSGHEKLKLNLKPLRESDENSHEIIELVNFTKIITLNKNTLKTTK